MTLSLLHRRWEEGERDWHCATHGGPDRPGDRQRDRWRPAMEPCVILAVSEPDARGHLTYTIATPLAPQRTVSDSWLSSSPDLPPPYFDR